MQKMLAVYLTRTQSTLKAIPVPQAQVVTAFDPYAVYDFSMRAEMRANEANMIESSPVEIKPDRQTISGDANATDEVYLKSFYRTLAAGIVDLNAESALSNSVMLSMFLDFHKEFWANNSKQMGSAARKLASLSRIVLSDDVQTGRLLDSATEEAKTVLRISVNVKAFAKIAGFAKEKKLGPFAEKVLFTALLKRLFFKLMIVHENDFVPQQHIRKTLFNGYLSTAEEEGRLREIVKAIRKVDETLGAYLDQSLNLKDKAKPVEPAPSFADENAEELFPHNQEWTQLFKMAGGDAEVASAAVAAKDVTSKSTNSAAIPSRVETAPVAPSSITSTGTATLVFANQPVAVTGTLAPRAGATSVSPAEVDATLPPAPVHADLGATLPHEGSAALVGKTEHGEADSSEKEVAYLDFILKRALSDSKLPPEQPRLVQKAGSGAFGVVFTAPTSEEDYRNATPELHLKQYAVKVWLPPEFVETFHKLPNGNVDIEKVLANLRKRIDSKQEFEEDEIYHFEREADVRIMLERQMHTIYMAGSPDIAASNGFIKCVLGGVEVRALVLDFIPGNKPAANNFAKSVSKSPGAARTGKAARQSHTQLPDERRVGEFFYGLGRAVGRTFQRNVIHRDLKPDNVMMLRDQDRNLMTKLLDFGAAKFIKAGVIETDDAKFLDSMLLDELLGSGSNGAGSSAGSSAVERVDVTQGTVIIGSAPWKRLIGFSDAQHKTIRARFLAFDQNHVSCDLAALGRMLWEFMAGKSPLACPLRLDGTDLPLPQGSGRDRMFKVMLYNGFGHAADLRTVNPEASPEIQWMVTKLEAQISPEMDDELRGDILKASTGTNIVFRYDGNGKRIDQYTAKEFAADLESYHLGKPLPSAPNHFKSKAINSLLQLPGISKVTRSWSKDYSVQPGTRDQESAIKRKATSASRKFRAAAGAYTFVAGMCSVIAAILLGWVSYLGYQRMTREVKTVERFTTVERIVQAPVEKPVYESDDSPIRIDTKPEGKITSADIAKMDENALMLPTDEDKNQLHVVRGEEASEYYLDRMRQDMSGATIKGKRWFTRNAAGRSDLGRKKAGSELQPTRLFVNIPVPADKQTAVELKALIRFDENRPDRIVGCGHLGFYDGQEYPTSGFVPEMVTMFVDANSGGDANHRGGHWTDPYAWKFLKRALQPNRNDNANDEVEIRAAELKGKEAAGSLAPFILREQIPRSKDIPVRIVKFVEGAVMPNGKKSDGLDWMMEFDGKIQHYFRWRSGSKYLVLYTSGSEDAVMIHVESLEWGTAGKEAGSDKSAPAANRSKQKKTVEAKNASR